MDTPSAWVQWLCATTLLLAVLAGVFVLAWHGTLTGTEAITIVTTIVGIAGGAFAVHAGVNVGAKALQRNK